MARTNMNLNNISNDVRSSIDESVRNNITPHRIISFMGADSAWNATIESIWLPLRASIDNAVWLRMNYRAII